MPPCLRNDADWEQFQAELDEADFVVVGRLGHEAHPNVRNRRRLVLSGSARGLERRPDASWWNPAQTPWSAVVQTLAPRGGRFAVTGGRLVFDLFLTIGFDEFHLAQAEQCRIPGGVPIFSACASGRAAGVPLVEQGMKVAESRMLDSPAGVRLDIWRRGGAITSAGGGRA